MFWISILRLTLRNYSTDKTERRNNRKMLRGAKWVIFLLSVAYTLGTAHAYKIVYGLKLVSNWP